MRRRWLVAPALTLWVAACGSDGGGLGTAPCGYDLDVEGGTFAPKSCELQVITPGVPCDNCLEHSVAFVDTTPGHIYSVTLFNFVAYEARSFTYDPAQDLREVNGQVIDVGSVVRNLETATVDLAPKNDGTAHVTFDALFANGIHVRGDGALPVNRYNAP